MVPVEARIPASGSTEMAPEAAQVSVLRIKHELVDFLQLRKDDRMKLVTEVIASMETWAKHAAEQRINEAPEKADAKDRSTITLSADRQKPVEDTVGLERVLYTARARLQERGGDHTATAAKDEATLWKWLYVVIHAGYETVDVLEERSKTKKTAKPNAFLKKKKKKVSSFVSSYLTSLVKKTRRRDESAASKLKEINGRLESLLKEANTSGYYHYYKGGSEDLVTSSKVDEAEVYCHKVDKKSVLEHLLPGKGDEEDDRVKVVSIVGCGGSGKTILAKSVFNDPVAEKHFQLRVWVSVSNYSFDEKRLAQNILGRDVKELELESAALVFQQILGCFSGKVFLCVLDDVWNDYESSKWVRFASLLRAGAPGSRILVTTRSERFAQVVGTDWVHNLKPLSNSDWWLIWKDRLLLSEDNKISKKMVDIGSKMAEKCEGLPLLAVALAEVLMDKNMTAQDWEGELRKLSEMGDEIWKVDYVATELFRHFDWSYPMLSSPLKLCILHCADFEKGTVIVVDQLIRMWMAQGYLGDDHETDEAKTLKGLEYFNDLASRSFFQDFVRGSIHKNMITSCKLNYTFHDFVRHMACHNSVKFGEEEHSTVQEKRREGYYDIKLHAGGIPQHSSGWQRWKNVKALVLSSSHLKQVPDEVALLSHVKYLDLSNNPIKELPETICSLRFLEHLDVHRCYLLLCLPQHIENLSQIKHLRVDHTTEELHKDLPEGFEKLTLIRTLDVFRAGGSYTDAINKLKRFLHLTDICITIHGEVKFSDADLHNKRCLSNLELCFVGEGRDEDKAGKSMEDLRPPANLQMLKFENYPLTVLPSWILEPAHINNLTRLSLKSAWNITSFPALWTMSSLEFLWLYDIVNLKHIGREFLGLPDKQQLIHNEEEEAVVDYVEDDVDNTVQGDHQSPCAGKTTAFCRLKTLRIECMKNLDEWEDLSEDEKMVNDIIVMPSLEELIIDRCPKLEALPLRILGDTPWFKISRSTNSEAVESVLPIGKTSWDKDSYMKLKKSVRDAYIDKGLTYDFEVSIPEGVFGNAEKKSCLPLKDLCRWFQPDGWLFAEQLSIWSKLVYELMSPADKKRVQMVSSDLTTAVGRTEEQRAEDLVNFMNINKAELYLVPYITPDHWELLAIVPEIGVTYRLDSLHGDIKTELTRFLKMVETSYANQSLDSNQLLDTWRTVHIKHKKQTENWECGYYVMIWMHKIAVNIQSLDLEPYFPLDDSPYKPQVLEELAHIWCAYISPSLVHPEAEAV